MAPRRSVIWYHFEILKDKCNAKCLYCKQVLSTKNGSMGNLNRHMKTKHPTISIARKEVIEITTAAPENTNSKGTYLENMVETEAKFTSNNLPGTSAATTNLSNEIGSFLVPTKITKQTKTQSDITSFAYSKKPLSIIRSREIDQQILRWIVKGFHAFRVVEEVEFQSLCKILCPNYNVPSRKTISSSLLQQLYQSKRDQIEAELNEVDYICVTTDSWTSINNEGFTAITVHFIIEEQCQLKLKSYLLDCFAFEDKHTAQNLATLLGKKFKEWKIEQKIVCVVSDNAHNIIAAVREGGWKSRSCFAHSINLLVQNGLKKLDPTFEKLKAIVSFFKRSSTALAKLKKTQLQMGLPELKIKQDVRTRWNSTLDMVDRACKIKDAIISTIALESECQNLSNLTINEWSILEELVNILQIFKDITDDISAEKSVTSSKIFIFVRAIYYHLRDLTNKQDLDNELKTVVKDMLNQFYTRFGDIENIDILAESTILDPRFKKFGFKDENKYTTAVANLRKKLSAIRANNDPPTNQELIRLGPESVPKKSTMWSHFDENVNNLVQEKNTTAAVIIELDRYISEPLINRNEDPLIWWMTRKHVYPTLFNYAKKRLCIQATSVPCERIFSKAGQVLTQKRSTLKSSKVTQILFLNSNL